MKYFIVSIGGTGSREAEMIVHLAAIGMLENCDELMVYYVDADEQNGDTNRLQNVIRAYSKMRKSLVEDCEERFPHDFMHPRIEMQSFGIRNCILALGDGADNPKYLDLAGENTDHLSLKMLNLLHPKFDQSITLEHGFYGDPAMGAAIFRAVSQTEPFQENELFNKLEQELGANTGVDQCVVLTGSVFGGTGAALFPNFAEKIRDRFSEKSHLHIGGALFLPYFTFPGEKGATVTSTDFLAKTAAALDSYSDREYNPEKGKKDLVKNGRSSDYIFDALWLCGYPERESTSDRNVDGGQDQYHRHHFVELLAALLSCQFMNEQGVLPGDASKKQLYTYRLNPQNDTLEWDVFPPELKSRISAFARFCVLHLTTVRAILGSKDAIKNNTLKGMFGSTGLFGLGGDAKCDIDDLRKQANDAADYCKAFLDMLLNMNRCQNPPVSLVEVNNLQNVLNNWEKPLDLEKANKLCKLKVVPDDLYGKQASDFTGMWGSFKDGKNASDSANAMKYLYAAFYKMCCDETRGDGSK